MEQNEESRNKSTHMVKLFSTKLKHNSIYDARTIGYPYVKKGNRKNFALYLTPLIKINSK